MRFISAVNDEETLGCNLLRSAALRKPGANLVRRAGFKSAGEAFATLETSGDAHDVYVHQDVYLPIGWDAKIAMAIDDLERRGEPWGVLGVWGIRESGEFVGRTWCNGGDREHAAVCSEPVSVVAVDEIVIVLNNTTGLRFDEGLPGFHLYGTDIILQARQQGLKAFVIDAPVVHNSRYNPRPVDRHYIAAYRYMQRKWRSELPVPTCVVPITRTGLPLVKHLVRREMKLLKGGRVERSRHPSPAAISKRLGYE